MGERKEFDIFLEQQLEQKVDWSYLMAGSVNELPLLYILSNITDIDHMNIPMTVCAIPDDAPLPQTFIGRVLRVDTSNIHPGFARLRYDLESSHRSHVYLNRNRIRGFKNLSGPAHISPLVTSEEVIEIASNEELYLMNRMDTRELTVDFVTAIFCPAWPDEANEWISRRRNEHWPSNELIEKIVMKGCHFVCKSHPNTPQDASMFRFSFSMAEILLVRSWSDRQKYIYHVLRTIKKDMAKKCSEKNIASVICSYTMKTLMLWACENKSADVWTNRSKEAVITELLCDLSLWLGEKKCPNYFIRSNNMFDHFDDKEIDATLQLVNAYITGEIPLPMCLDYEEISSGERFLSFFLQGKSVLLLQLWLPYLIPFHTLYRSNVCPAYVIVDGGREFEDLFQAISAQRKILEFDKNVESESCRTPKQFIERKFVRALSDFSGVSSEIILNLSVPLLENAFPFQNQVAFLQHKQRRRFCVYSREEKRKETQRRSSHHDENISTEWKTSCKHMIEFVFRILEAVFPRVVYFLAAAYRCNYYFSYLNDFQRSWSVCEEAFLCCAKSDRNALAGSNYNNYCSVILSSKWCVIFDRYLQVSFGFLLLHKYLAKKQSAEFNQDLMIRFSPMGFIKYIMHQSQQCSVDLLTGCHMKRHEHFRFCGDLLLDALTHEKRVEVGRLNQKCLDEYCPLFGLEKLNAL